MPIALDPRELFSYVLESDREKVDQASAEKPPTFWFRFLTGREQLQALGHDEAVAEARANPDRTSAREILAGAYEAVRIGLATWEAVVGRDGVAIGFEADRLEDVVGLGEVYELLGAMLRGAEPTAADLGNSDAPSLTPADLSAAADAPLAGEPESPETAESPETP